MDTPENRIGGDELDRQGSLGGKILYVDMHELLIKSIQEGANRVSDLKLEAWLYNPKVKNSTLPIFTSAEEIAEYAINKKFDGVIVGNSVGTGTGGNDYFGKKVAELLKQQSFKGPVAIVHHDVTQTAHPKLVASGAIIGDFYRDDMISEDPEKSALIAVSNAIKAQRSKEL